MTEISLPLIGTTPKEWTQKILANFDMFLLDHASCERKAAALAMSFISKYADRKCLIEPMVSLAREELEHFAQVYRLLVKRGIAHDRPDEKDDYVNGILQKLRHGRDERFLDRLLMSGLVEARGYERFAILSHALHDEPELKTFYHDLARKELGHYRIFFNIAEIYFSKEEVAEATARIAQYEYESMMQTPLTSRLH